MSKFKTALKRSLLVYAIINAGHFAATCAIPTRYDRQVSEMELVESVESMPVPINGLYSTVALIGMPGRELAYKIFEK